MKRRGFIKRFSAVSAGAVVAHGAVKEAQAIPVPEPIPSPILESKKPEPEPRVVIDAGDNFIRQYYGGTCMVCFNTEPVTKKPVKPTPAQKRKKWGKLHKLNFD